MARVLRLPAAADRDTVLHRILQERLSRWPVVDPDSERPNRYLFTKDLIANAANAAAEDWLSLARPLKSVRPDDTIEDVLVRMQAEEDSMYLVEDDERPVGLVTLEGILERVVEQIEDEYPHGTT